MALTTQQVRGFKPKDKPYKKGDERGLYLLVKPNGSKLWHLKYRFGGREKKMPMGLSVISCVGGRLNITPPWP